EYVKELCVKTQESAIQSRKKELSAIRLPKEEKDRISHSLNDLIKGFPRLVQICERADLTGPARTSLAEDKLQYLSHALDDALMTSDGLLGIQSTDDELRALDRVAQREKQPAVATLIKPQPASVPTPIPATSKPTPKPPPTQ